MTRRVNRKSDRFTVAVPIAVGRLIRQQAESVGITPSAAAARLLEEATRIDVEHQHAALIEAAVGRALGQRLERMEDLVARSAIHAYRGRCSWQHCSGCSATAWQPNRARQPRNAPHGSIPNHTGRRGRGSARR